MTNNDAAKLYEAKLQNPNLNIEEIIKAVCETRNDPEGYAQNLISEYYKIIKDAELHGHSGMDIVKYLKETKDEIFVANLDKEGNIEIAEEYEEKLPNNIFEDKTKAEVNFPDAEVNTGKTEEPPKDNVDFKDKPINDTKTGDFQFGDESTEGIKYLTNNEEFDSLDIGDGVASAPKEPGISKEQLNQLKKLAEEQREQNNPDAKINTTEGKEPPKDNIDFKDKPINDTKTGDFQFGDESTEGIKYLTNNEEFDSLDIDDGNDNTPPDDGNDNTPPSGPILK